MALLAQRVDLMTREELSQYVQALQRLRIPQALKAAIARTESADDEPAEPDEKSKRQLTLEALDALDAL